MNFDSNFEVLLARAAKKSAEDEVSELMELDTSAMEITQSEKMRFEQILNPPKGNKKRTPAKILLIACLVAIAVVMTACATIPQIWQKFKELVVQLNDQYFSVSFNAPAGNGDDYIEDKLPFAETEPNEKTQTPEETTEPITPPSKIEKKAYLSYLPGNYQGEVIANERNHYSVLYYNSDGEVMIRLTQNTITNTNWLDSGGSAEKIFINGNVGLLSNKSMENSSIFTILWSDGQYLYYLSGEFTNQEEAIEVAKHLKIE